MKIHKEIITTTYDGKQAEIIKELFRYPNDFEVQKITLILNNHEKNIQKKA